MADRIQAGEVRHTEFVEPLIRTLRPYDRQRAIEFAMGDVSAQVSKTFPAREMGFQFGQNAARKNRKASDALGRAERDAGTENSALAETGDDRVL